MQDKENLHANASFSSPAPSLLGTPQGLRASHIKQSAPRFLRPSRGKSFSPATIKQILLRELGPSPSREALSSFVSRLSREERRLFLSREDLAATPNQDGLPATPQLRMKDASPSPLALRYGSMPHHAYSHAKR
jgi:hypothetical protein